MMPAGRRASRQKDGKVVAILRGLAVDMTTPLKKLFAGATFFLAGVWLKRAKSRSARIVWLGVVLLALGFILQAASRILGG